ncbi:MAG: hypothetical protein ACK5NY_06810 [Burkholderiaceae bacterium]
MKDDHRGRRKIQQRQDGRQQGCHLLAAFMVRRMLGGLGRIITMNRTVDIMVMASDLPVFYFVGEIKRISFWRPTALQREGMQWQHHQ